MRRHREWRRHVKPLPLQATYTLSELATAAALSRGRLVRLFQRVGVQTMRVGTLILVPLSELEDKA